MQSGSICAIRTTIIQGWIPSGIALVRKNFFTRLEKLAAIGKKLTDLFGAEKCVISREGLIKLAAFNLHSYGGSDESTMMIVAGTLDMLFQEIGFECTPEQLGKGVPSPRTIARYEMHLAVDCIIVTLQEIKDDGSTQVGMMTDHGHRAGQDHFVTVLVWSGRDSNGSRTLKFFCPSIDLAGHTAQEAADGVKNVWGRFLGGGEIKLQALMGDRGGGGAVQHTYPKLVEMKIMTEDGKEGPCTLHGNQKALENASKKTMGDQGLGIRSTFQMLYVFSALTGKIRSLGGVGLFDTLWGVVMEELKTNTAF